MPAAGACDRVARIQNEQLAKLVESSTRALPCHGDAAHAGAEAGHRRAAPCRERARVARGQIGSNVAGKNLDDPELEPVWATAAELGAFILIHPIAVAGADRLSSYYLTNLIGNPPTPPLPRPASHSAGSWTLSHPEICLAHGGGFVPYQAGRFVHGWQVRQESQEEARQAAD